MLEINITNNLIEKTRCEFLFCLNNMTNIRKRNNNDALWKTINRNKKSSRPCCCNCNSEKIHIHGYRNGNVRYKCKVCNKTFTQPTIIKYLHKDYEERFIQFVKRDFRGSNLDDLAEDCNISKSCAFKWRHKLLYALDIINYDKLSNNIIELDDTYFYNSSKGRFNQLKLTRTEKDERRRARIRKRGLNMNLVCVTTLIDRSKLTNFSFSGFGKISYKRFSSSLRNTVEGNANTTIVTDYDSSYPKAIKEIGCKHVALKPCWNESKKYYKPEYGPNGEVYHLQNVNSLHSVIKSRINHTHRGVSTKYLNRYISSVLLHKKAEFKENLLKYISEVGPHIPTYRKIIKDYVLLS